MIRPLVSPHTTGISSSTMLKVAPLAARLQNVLAGGLAGVHVYGNSIAAAGSFIYSLCGQSGGRLYLAKNSGVGGYTSTQVLAKLLVEGLDPTAKILLYIEGTNDAGQGVSVATHISNMRAIAEYAIARDVIPVLCVTPPRDSTFVVEANNMAISDQLVGVLNGIPTYDLFARYVDSADGTWTVAAGGDGVHPSQSTYGKAGVDMWDSIFNTKPCYIIPRTNGGNGLWLSNVLSLTDSDANGLPNDWQVITFTGQTYPAQQDYAFPFRGKRSRLTSSQTTTGGTLYRVLGKSGKFADGDEILVAGVLGVDAITNARLVVYVRPQGSGQPDIYLGGFTDVTPDTYLQSKFKVPVGTTDLRLFIKFESDVAGTHGGTIGYGCWDFYNLTTQLV